MQSAWDNYYLDVDSTRSFEVAISWDHPADDFNLYVYKGRVPKNQNAPSGPAAGSSTRASGTQERLSIANTEGGEYTIRVIYSRVTQSVYRGAALLATDLPVAGRAERRAYPLTPNDQLLRAQWGISKIHAADAWQERNATGHGITIGIVDSGVELTHPDLTCPGKLLVLEGATIGSNLPPEDTDGHGTHVAGIAAACTDNGTGVAGVAPDATIMPVNVIDAMLDSDLLPGGSDAAMAAGIRFACGLPADPSDPCGTDGNGAHVINLSIGPPPQEGSHFPNFYPKTEKALEEARQAGVVIVAASGNTSSPICQYPALSRYVICVGATDGNDRKTGYSDFPNNVDSAGRFHASVVAPGGDLVPSDDDVCSARILSTYLQSETASCSPATGYAGLAGTSMASPHVAGVAALVYDRLGGDRKAANANKVVEAIIETADSDLYAPGYDAFSGYGLVDAWAAVNFVEVPEEEEKVTDPTPDPDPTDEPEPDPEPEPEPDPEPEPEPQPDPDPSPSSPPPAPPYGLVVSPSEAKGRVGSETVITATVVDIDGRPIEGATVEWASVGVGGIAEAEAVTDEAGLASARLVSHEPGDQHVMAWTSSCGDGGDCVDEAIRHHGPERCDIFGTVGDDVLRGTDAADVICGFDGNDVVFADAGDDVVFVHGGDDRVQGGDGDDRLYGGAGHDRLAGELGADLLVGGPGSDSLDGGPGMDTCHDGSNGDRLKSCRT